MKKNNTQVQIMAAVAAAEAKKAENVTILELDKASGSFTDYFVICSGSNPRQIQAISDEVEEQLRKAGDRPAHVEGYNQAEWVLLDYVDFVVHIFSDKARAFYDLERLWKSAKHLDPHALKSLDKGKPAARKRTGPPAATSSRTPRKRSPHSRKPA
jgi:ribosome-associated protein